MRKLLAVLLASGMVAATTGAGLAECSWGVAHKGENMTVAESVSPDAEEEAITTFDPPVLYADDDDDDDDDDRELDDDRDDIGDDD